jgi:hypothetical protein
MTKGLFVKLITILLVSSSLWAQANPSCDILAKYDGQYFKTHDDCDQHSYSQIQVYQKSPEDHVHSLKNLDVMVNGDIIENHSGALCD